MRCGLPPINTARRPHLISPRQLQGICKAGNPESLAAQGFEAPKAPRRLQDLLQKPHFFSNEVLWEIQTPRKSFINKAKPPKSLDLSGFVELLPRFELGTSSLPILPRLFSPVVSCFVLALGAVVTQRFPVIFYCSFMFPVLHLRMGFFDARMGFVWVSTPCCTLNFLHL